MRIARIALIVCVASLAACRSKKKEAPPVDPAGSAKLAPVLQPTQNKLDNAMDKEDKRATPEPEGGGTGGN